MSNPMYFDCVLDGNILLFKPKAHPVSSSLAVVLTHDLIEALRYLNKDQTGLQLGRIQSMKDEDRCWPIKEISRRTNIPESTIRRWCAEDRVKYLRRGKGYWPHLDSILAYAAETRTAIKYDGYLK